MPPSEFFIVIINYTSQLQNFYFLIILSTSLYCIFDEILSYLPYFFCINCISSLNTLAKASLEVFLLNLSLLQSSFWEFFIHLFICFPHTWISPILGEFSFPNFVLTRPFHWSIFPVTSRKSQPEPGCSHPWDDRGVHTVLLSVSLPDLC